MTGIARHLDHLYCRLQHRTPLSKDDDLDKLINQYRYIAIGSVSIFSISDIHTYLQTFDSILLDNNQAGSGLNDQQLLIHLSVLEECVHQAIEQERDLIIAVNPTEQSKWIILLLPFICTSMLQIQGYQKYHLILLNILEKVLAYASLDQSLVRMSIDRMIDQASHYIQQVRDHNNIQDQLFCKVLLQLYQFLDAKSQNETLVVQVRHCILDLASSAAQSLPLNEGFLHSMITCIFEKWLQGNKEEVNAVLDFFHSMLNRYEYSQASTELMNESSAYSRMLLNFVWNVISHQPILMSNEKIQNLICYGMRSSESLTRKYSLGVLQIAFASYSGVLSVDSFNKPPDKLLKKWSVFLAASQVIQFQQEQHLVEQVWPQIQELLYCCLQTEKLEITSGQFWPVALSFKWLQSLFSQIFDHKNPILRRKLLGGFMETCLKAMEIVIQDIRSGQTAPENTRAMLAIDIDFHLFVMTTFLPATNDPLLYKTNSSKSTHLLETITEFLAKWLSAYYWQNISSEKHTNILRKYVFYVHEAIFSDTRKRHSQDALLAMLRVFQSNDLQIVMKYHDHQAISSELLDTKALDTLRFMLEIYILPSYSVDVQHQSLLAVQAAMTEGLTQPPDEHALLHLSKILLLFPMIDLIGTGDEQHGACYLHLYDWLHLNKENAEWFTEAIIKAIEDFVHSDHPEGGFLPKQLARLMLFTATKYHDETNKAIFKLDKPLFRRRQHLSKLDSDDHRLYFSLLAAWENEVQEVLQYQVHDQCHTSLRISVDPIGIYQQINQKIDDRFSGCEWLFSTAMELAEAWLDHVCGTSRKLWVDEYCSTLWLNNVVRVGTQVAIHLMEARGSLVEFCLLSNLTLRFSVLVVAPRTQLRVSETVQIYELQTIAMEFLATMSKMQPHVAEMIPLFHASHPFLQSLCHIHIEPSGGNNGPNDAEMTPFKSYNKALAAFTVARWQVIHTIVTSSPYLPTQLKHQVTKACVEAFETMGSQPETLLHITETLTCCSTCYIKDEPDHDASDSIINSVWNTYMDCSTRTDALTQAVIFFVLENTLSYCANPQLFTKWFTTIFEYGENNRPNVIYHLATRLCRIWQQDLDVASSFVPMILKFLLYREPKEINRSTKNISGIKSPTHDQFVRLRVLTWLEQLSETPKITDSLILMLLQHYVNDPDWQKPQMIHSHVFGYEVRAWQALCVLTRHISSLSLLQKVEDLFYNFIFCLPKLSAIRHYYELFGMRLLERSNDLQVLPDTLQKHILPLLFNFNQPPQQMTSLLLILGHFVHIHIEKYSVLALKTLTITETLSTPHPIQTMPIIETLISGFLCWLNASHGHVRVIAQYFLRTLLPHYIALNENEQRKSGMHPLEWRFLTETCRFLSENKECMRMSRRQSLQIANIQPGHRCSVQGLLESTYWHVESNDILPKEDQFSWTFQIRESLKHTYTQFQLEYTHSSFHENPAALNCIKQDLDNLNQRNNHETPSLESIPVDASISVVQRKIDVSSRCKTFTIDPPLPVTSVNDSQHLPSSAMSGNSCYPKGNRVIMCASLIEKVTNLAGLARTCEIFGAEKLVVSNLRVLNNDATFASMSSSAHKWIRMEEIPCGEALIHAIRQWKEVDKYQIIALEQTSRSQCCSEFRFPDNVVIILGSEGAGIPVEILRLVDVCVEIPQFGLVRSLNVHVSGAILLWEYTRQRLLGSIDSTD